MQDATVYRHIQMYAAIYTQQYMDIYKHMQYRYTQKYVYRYIQIYASRNGQGSPRLQKGQVGVNVYEHVNFFCFLIKCQYASGILSTIILAPCWRQYAFLNCGPMNELYLNVCAILDAYWRQHGVLYILCIVNCGPICKLQPPKQSTTPEKENMNERCEYA